MREETQRVTKTASGASAPEAPAFPVLGRRSEELLAAVRAFARVDETMLLSGPSGAGKTRLAALCHAWSARSRGPFQLVDLLSVPEEMQMAELFGWRRGAFTGAVRDHAGFVAGSNGGTLFIDEIDKLSLRTQAGLLNFMESKTFRALGDAAGLQADLDAGGNPLEVTLSVTNGTLSLAQTTGLTFSTGLRAMNRLVEAANQRDKAKT